jgi:hypothetical protein
VSSSSLKRTAVTSVMHEKDVSNKEAIVGKLKKSVSLRVAPAKPCYEVILLTLF